MRLTNLGVAVAGARWQENAYGAMSLPSIFRRKDGGEHGQVMANLADGRRPCVWGMRALRRDGVACLCLARRAPRARRGPTHTPAL